MTYDEFVGRIRTLQADRDGQDLDLTAVLPEAIEEAELRCLRDLVPLAMIRRQATTVQAGTARLTPPQDFVAARAVRYDPPSAPPRQLARRDNRYLEIYWPDTTVTGIPKYWSQVGVAEILVVPPAAAVADYDLQYLARPAALSATTTTTWLSTWAPDLLVAAAMVFLAGYNRTWVQGNSAVAHWEAQYTAKLAGLLKEDAARRGMIDVPPGPG